MVHPNRAFGRRWRRAVALAFVALLATGAPSEGEGWAAAKKPAAKKVGAGAKKAKAGPKIGVLKPDPPAGLAAGLKKAPASFDGAVRKGLAKAGFRPVALAALSDSLAAMSCVEAEAECLARLAATMDLKFLAVLRLTPEGAGALRLKVELYAGGKVAATLDDAYGPMDAAKITAAMASVAAPVGGTKVDGTGTAAGTGVGAGPPAGAPGALEITTIPLGAAVSVDGVGRGPSPLTVDGLTPGFHEVEATLDGYEPASSGLMVEPGGKTPVVLELEAAVADVPAADEGSGKPGPFPPKLRRTVGIAVAGAGVLAVAGAFATGFATKAARSDFEGFGAPGTIDDFHALEDIVSRGRLFATLTKVLFSAGVALAVGGGALAVSSLFGKKGSASGGSGPGTDDATPGEGVDPDNPLGFAPRPAAGGVR